MLGNKRESLGDLDNENEITKDKIQNVSIMQLYNEIKEFQKKERTYIAQVYFKDKEIKGLQNQLNDLVRSYQEKKSGCCYYDPLVLNEFKVLKSLIQERDEKIKLKDEELSSLQTNQNDPQFKRLVNKCRELHKENMDLFKYAQGETLENLKQENATEKNQINQLMLKLKEKDSINTELENELNEINETISSLTRKLKEIEDKNSDLEKEIKSLNPKAK